LKALPAQHPAPANASLRYQSTAQIATTDDSLQQAAVDVPYHMGHRHET